MSYLNRAWVRCAVDVSITIGLGDWKLVPFVEGSFSGSIHLNRFGIASERVLFQRYGGSSATKVGVLNFAIDQREIR